MVRAGDVAALRRVRSDVFLAAVLGRHRRLHRGISDWLERPTGNADADHAERTGEALGVQVKPEGERRLQPVVDRFFYWLRATVLETRRLANWWADRMVATAHPLATKAGEEILPLPFVEVGFKIYAASLIEGVVLSGVG